GFPPSGLCSRIQGYTPALLGVNRGYTRIRLQVEMREETPGRDEEGPAMDGGRALDGCASLVDRLYAQSKADQWGVPREQFYAALERSAKKRLTSGAGTAQKLEEYLRGLRIEDLALAAACAEGCEDAWEHFLDRKSVGEGKRVELGWS